MRPHYLPAPIYRNLDRACVQIRQAFGTPYLVGSATQRPDYRDVDVRVILFDDEFVQLFPGRADAKARMESNMRWSIVCSLVSQHLSQITGLSIDFQIQSMTQANADKGTNRIALGVVPALDDPQPAPAPPCPCALANGSPCPDHDIAPPGSDPEVDGA